MDSKPGYKTTEFWTTVGMLFISSLAVLGFVGVGEASQLKESWANVVGAVFTLVINAGVVVNYIKSRIEYKKSMVPASPPASKE